jgi:hypothetical protein
VHVRLWRDLDYGVLIGPAIAAVVLIEVLMIRILVRAAARARRAPRAGVISYADVVESR